MAHIIIDRRKNGRDKSAPNRRKFNERVKERLREHVKEVITDSTIESVTKRSGEKINIPARDLKEPSIHHDQGGIQERIYPGNKDFATGDRINRPPKGGGGGGGGDASDSGEGEDDFEFTITREEFLEIFFEDLELPDLVEKAINSIEEFKYKRAGFSTDGNPARMDLLRSMKESGARRSALRTPKKRKIKKLQKELDELLIFISKSTPEECTIERERVKVIELEIKELTRKMKLVPYIDDMDLRYRQWKKEPVPISQAAMICIMDVSGSMSANAKELAKRFYILLHMFLDRNYERIDIRFIRHHTSAKEVNENDFFYDRETGGTMVSSGLELAKEIIKTDYDRTAWNVYICQASDGDNWGGR